MANKVILKKSSVSGRIPVTDTVDPAVGLAYGELAINYADGIIYYKKADGTTIASISSGSSSTIAKTFMMMGA